MEIKSISEKIFKTSPGKAAVTNNHSNPFGVSFKGNMISADVFESANKMGLAQKASGKCKMLVSTVVGSINDMASAIGTRFNKRLESMASFGKKMKENTANLLDKLNNNALVFDIANNKSIFRISLKDNSLYNKKLLMKKDPETGIAPVFKDLISSMEVA